MGAGGSCLTHATPVHANTSAAVRNPDTLGVAVHMRPWSLISILAVCAGCTVRLPSPGRIPVRVNTSARIDVRAQAHVHTPVVTATSAPPPVPNVLVPLQGASVVEFFGIPLEGAQDVVFVLDISGSMAHAAQGRLAEIRVTHGDAPPPPPVDAPPQPGPAGGVSTEPPPPPPTFDASSEPPPPPSPYDEPPAPEPAPAAPALRKIDVAQVELVDALERLPAGTRINVLFFHSEVDGYAPALFSLDDAKRGDLISFVQQTAPDGNTALTPAMRVALLMNARRIVLLSDGFGNVGPGDETLLRDARAAMQSGVRIDTVGVGDDTARRYGGQWRISSTREYGACVKAAVDVLTGRDPVHLGRRETGVDDALRA